MSETNPIDQLYKPDPIGSDIWRRVIAATLEFETDLQLGNNSTPEQFASRYPNLPSEILTPELRRLYEEFKQNQNSKPSTDQIDPTAFELRYSQLQLLRVGGMGEIYRAIDLECQRQVAIKKIRPEFQDHQEAQRRFHAEASLTAGLEHPGIIPIYGRGVDQQGRDFYAMRLIQGDGTGTLSNSIRSFHEQSNQSQSQEINSCELMLRELVRRLIDVADTIAYVHSQGIVHRDLKPSNILIGSYGETIIADWGLARRINEILPTDEIRDHYGVAHQIQSFEEIEDERTEINSAVTQGLGTPGYAAPELASQSEIGTLHLADVYSLGAILYCVVTGQPTDQGDANLRLKHRPPGYDSLKAIAIRAMSPSPSDRYATADFFRDELLNWIAGEPVVAHPEGAWERGLRWLKKNRTFAASVLSAMAIAIIAGSIFLWFQHEQNLKLQSALDISSKLLLETKRANEIAEKREMMAFDALSNFQDVIVSSLVESKPNGGSSLDKTLSTQSSAIFNSLLEQLQQETSPRIQTVNLISTMAQRLSVLSSGLRTTDLDVDAIESACAWMQGCLEDQQIDSDTQRILSLRIGELRSIQGNLAMGMMQPNLAKRPLEQALERLEPLLEDSQLPEDARQQAKVAWLKAISATSMIEFHAGKTGVAKTIQDRALKTIGQDRSATYDEAMVRVQIHGNMAMIHERMMEVDLALLELEFACGDLDAALGMIGQDVGGIVVVSKHDENQNESKQIIPTPEYLFVRSRIYHDRARLLSQQKNQPAAIKALVTLLEKDAQTVHQAPTNGMVLGFYQQTASALQSLMSRSSRASKAFEVSKEWIELADGLWRSNPHSIENALFLIVSHHQHGHLFQQVNRNDEALSAYRQALQLCDQATAEGMRSAKIYYQRVELEMHQFHLLYQTTKITEIEPIFVRAMVAAGQLKDLPTQSGNELVSAIDQLQRGIAAMRSAGDDAHATSWEQELKNKGFVR